MTNQIQVIGFDADDTLWVNEPYFYDTTRRFCLLLKEYAPCEQVENLLYRTEVGNIQLYGYGAKSFILSMVETALSLSNDRVAAATIRNIINLGKELINKPVQLIDGVRNVLDKLHREHFRLIVATKGDLLDQERKLEKSGLEGYFHHIEIMSDKQEGDYQRLLNHLEVKPESFMMVGNSLKSDILPVLGLGSYGVYVPFHTTWKHEELDESDLSHPALIKVDNISQIPEIIKNTNKH